MYGDKKKLIKNLKKKQLKISTERREMWAQNRSQRRENEKIRTDAKLERRYLLGLNKEPKECPITDCTRKNSENKSDRCDCEEVNKVKIRDRSRSPYSKQT